MKFKKKIGALSVAGILVATVIPSVAFASNDQLVDPGDLYSQNITINLRIMDFNGIQNFNETMFDNGDYAKTWDANTLEEEMIPFKISQTFIEPSTTATSLGLLLDQLNNERSVSKDLIFKFNYGLYDKPSPYGRFLEGVKKTPEELENQVDKEHNNYWGILEQKNSSGEWVASENRHGTYLAITSPTSNQITKNPLLKYDKRAGNFVLDRGLNQGVDKTNIKTDDIYNIDLWQMEK